VVADFGGSLARLPAGILVPDRASVDAYNATRREAPFDFTAVRFLAARAPISTAVSPRSFLNARNLPVSAAPQPFIGFAEPVPPPPEAMPSDAPVEIGPACFLACRELVALWENLAPIDSREVRLAAAAINAPGSPVIQGPSFTDSAIQQRSDLDQFRVLHFATHGFTEGQFGCPRSPPALLTSLGGDESNGLLELDEIAGLRLDANLVMLTACNTGSGVGGLLARASGQEEGGTTLEGLVRAFLTANSRAVLATHWPISNEQQTYDLMGAFYTEARERSIGESLQAAQALLMTNPEFSHPYYWGAFFLVGDASKMMLSGPVRVASTERR
jgi:CHAT domain-containing protein